MQGGTITQNSTLRISISLLTKHMLRRYQGLQTQAAKNRKFVVFGWNYQDGYYVVPTNRIPKQGFIQGKNMKIYLGNELEEGILAKAVKESINLSTM